MGPRRDLAEVTKTGLFSNRVTHTGGEGQDLRGVSDSSSREGSPQDAKDMEGMLEHR